MKIYFILFFAISITPITSFGDEDFNSLKQSLEEINGRINCNSQYNEEVGKVETPLKNYVECIDLLAQRFNKSKEQSRFTVQIFVTPDEGKANDLVNDYNSNLKKSDELASYIPYEVPYPGGHSLNDGRYYRIIVGSYATEKEAKSKAKKIRSSYRKNYKDSFASRIIIN